MNKKFLIKTLIVFFSVSFLNACTSTPATRFYSLAAMSAADEKLSLGSESAPSIGVGPVIIPDYLDVPGVISRSDDGARIYVSGGHAWAETLDNALSRVLADNLSQVTANDAIWSFPWDNRIRPALQLRLVVEKFEGVRGENAVLQFKWSIYDTKSKVLVSSGKETLSKTMQNDTYAEYISTLNALVDDASIVLSGKLKH